MEDINSNEFRKSNESFPESHNENVLIKVENIQPVESGLNQVQILYSVFDLQKSKRAPKESYRMNLFKSDFVSDGGLKEKFSKYYDSTTFNKSKTFTKSLSYTKLNNFTQSDGFNRKTATFNNTCSEFGYKFKPSSAKTFANPFNLQNPPLEKEKEIKILSPKSDMPIKKEKSFSKCNSNKTICSLRLSNERDNLLKKNSISNCEVENNQSSLNTNKGQLSSKSLSLEPKSPLIINNYFINSVNSPNLGNTIKEEKRLLTIEEKIDMMTKLVKTKEDIIIKQVKNELIQKEKEKNEKIQRKLNYLNDRNMLDNLKDEIIAENLKTSGDSSENKLVSLKSTNFEGKEMKRRMKASLSLDFNIDKKQILKPRVDSIEFLKKILSEKKRIKSKDCSKTLRKPVEYNFLSNSFRKSASKDKYKALTVDSRGFKDSNYNYTLRSRRTIKTEISDFIRRKNKEQKEKAIKLKDRENENLIKKYIELMKINNFLNKSNKINTLRSTKTNYSKEKADSKTENSKKKIKNIIYIGKENKRKNIDDSSFLDNDQYYLNILESKLILNPSFNLRRIASGDFIPNKETTGSNRNKDFSNIKSHRPKSSDILNLFSSEDNSKIKKENEDIKNKPQSKQEFLEFINRKESEIKIKSKTSREKSNKICESDLNKVAEKVSNKILSKFKEKNDSEICEEIIQIGQEQKPNDINRKNSNKQEEDIETVSIKKEKENSLSKRSSQEISQHISQTKTISSHSIEELLKILKRMVRLNVYTKLKEHTVSTYLIEHYIYAFNYLDALSDVFMAKNLSIVLNKINQYAYIKNLYDALNLFTIPFKRQGLAKIYTYSEIKNMYDQGEIEIYQNYLNFMTLFAKRDAFGKIKGFAMKVELEEYEEDEEKIIEIYKETLNKLSEIINRRYFINLIDCLSKMRNLSNKQNNSIEIRLNKVNSRYNSEKSLSKSLQIVEVSSNTLNESECSKFSHNMSNEVKTPNTSREKMKNFSKNKLENSLNKSDQIKKSFSHSRIKHNTYVYETLSEKSCVVECNSFQSPKLHRIYMLIEEQKRTQKYLRKKEDCDDTDEVKYLHNQSNKSKEEISNYYLDLNDENLETSNKNISMIEEVLTEEKDSNEKNSQKNLKIENNFTNSISLLDSSNGNNDSDKKFLENDFENKSKSIIKSVKLDENISEVIEKILDKTDEFNKYQENISEVIDNYIEKSIDKSINKSINGPKMKSFKSINNSVNEDFSIDLMHDFSKSKSSICIKDKSLNKSSIKKNILNNLNKSASIIYEHANSINKSSNIDHVVYSKVSKSFDKKEDDYLINKSNSLVNKENLDKFEMNYSKDNIQINNYSLDSAFKNRKKESRDNSVEIEGNEISRAYSVKSKKDNSLKEIPNIPDAILSKDSKLINKSQASEVNFEEEIDIAGENNFKEKSIIQELSASKKCKESESENIDKSEEKVFDKKPDYPFDEPAIKENLDLIIYPQENEIPIKTEKDLNNEAMNEMEEMAEIISNEILKDLLSNEIKEKELLPKKSFNLHKENQFNSSRYNNSTYSGSFYSSFNNPSQSDLNPPSIFNKTIIEHKKDTTQNIYEQKILPQLTKLNEKKVKENYETIIENLKIPYSYNINDLLLYLVKAPTINIKRNFLNLPKEMKDKNLIPKKIIFLTEFNEISNSIRKKSGFDKEYIEYDEILNQCVIDATEEIINKERLHGEQGEPLSWSTRSRNATLKYTQSEISKNNLIKFIHGEFINLSNSKMGLIQENNEDLEIEQFNLEKEKRMINKLTTYLQETDDIWKNFEVEETQVKLELTELVLEQILNETIEILEHVNMSRINPSLYQYKSIYACDDIPRLGIHQVNTDYENDVMNI